MVADNNTLTPEQMAARMAEPEGRLANNGTLSFMLAEKGAVSVYGLGGFPITLYFEQWNKLLPMPTNCGPSWKPTNQN